MCRAILCFSLSLMLAIPDRSGCAQTYETVVTEHLRIAAPLEQGWLARDTIPDLERCWHFMNAAISGSLPRRVSVTLRPDASLSAASAADDAIIIGLEQRTVGPTLASFVSHEAMREMARLGLLKFARQNAPVPGTEFLYEGMAEILTHEFDRSTRLLGSARIIANLLDRMQLLGFGHQSSWAAFSQGRHDLRSTAPGVTFLMMCRERYGREKTLKLFEAFRKDSLNDSLSSAFKATSAALEADWLKKVREQPAWADVTLTSEDDCPVLAQAQSTPESVKPGQIVQVRLFVRDPAGNLLETGVFLQDIGSGRVYQPQRPASAAGYLAIDVPVESSRAPGKYTFRIIAIDESGNVRNWESSYLVAAHE